MVDAEVDGVQWSLVVCARSSGQPRVAREATNALYRDQSRFRDPYPVLAAPYISPTAADVCRREGVGGLLGINAPWPSSPFASSVLLAAVVPPQQLRPERVLVGARMHSKRLWGINAGVRGGKEARFQPARVTRTGAPAGRGFPVAAVSLPTRSPARRGAREAAPSPSPTEEGLQRLVLLLRKSPPPSLGDSQRTSPKPKEKVFTPGVKYVILHCVWRTWTQGRRPGAVNAAGFSHEEIAEVL